jgi:arylsulfatase A-like enzyme
MKKLIYYYGDSPVNVEGFPEDCKRSRKGALHLLRGRSMTITADEYDHIAKAYKEVMPKIRVVAEVDEEAREAAKAKLAAKKAKKIEDAKKAEEVKKPEAEKPKAEAKKEQPKAESKSEAVTDKSAAKGKDDGKKSGLGKKFK